MHRCKGTVNLDFHSALHPNESVTAKLPQTVTDPAKTESLRQPAKAASQPRQLRYMGTCKSHILRNAKHMQVLNLFLPPLLY
jgi:hypothetical protein